MATLDAAFPARRQAQAYDKQSNASAPNDADLAKRLPYIVKDVNTSEVVARFRTDTLAWKWTQAAGGGFEVKEDAPEQTQAPADTAAPKWWTVKLSNVGVLAAFQDRKTAEAICTKIGNPFGAQECSAITVESLPIVITAGYYGNKARFIDTDTMRLYMDPVHCESYYDTTVKPVNLDAPGPKAQVRVEQATPRPPGCPPERSKSDRTMSKHTGVSVKWEPNTEYGGTVRFTWEETGVTEKEYQAMSADDQRELVYRLFDEQANISALCFPSITAVGLTKR